MKNTAYANVVAPRQIPHNLYMQIQYKIRDYDRLCQKRKELLHSTAPPPDGMPRITRIGDPTGRLAVQLANINVQISAIEKSAEQLCQLYIGRSAEGFDPIAAYKDYDYFRQMLSPDSAKEGKPSRRTWNYFKVLFSRLIAEKLCLF